MKMKASLKFREDPNQMPLLRAKIPVTVLGLPLISSIAAGDSSDLSFHLRTAAMNGPSIKLSYRPNDSLRLFSVSIKSGIGFLGSPDSSPLLMQANFNLFENTNPSFSLQIRPEFGDFSFKKAIFSNPNPPSVANTNSGKENGTVRDPNCNTRENPLSGISVKARTSLPVTKLAGVKLRWGVNFPAELRRENLPFLTVDKISIEGKEEAMHRRDDGASVVSDSINESARDLELLKGVCLWIRKEVDDLRRESRSTRERLKELKFGKRSIEIQNSGENSQETRGSSEIGKEKASGNDNVNRKIPSSVGSAPLAPDIEAELKKAIKAKSP